MHRASFIFEGELTNKDRSRGKETLPIPRRTASPILPRIPEATAGK